MSRRKKQEAVFLRVYTDENNKETYHPYRYSIVDEEVDGVVKKKLLKEDNPFIKTVPFNRKARRISDKSSGKSRLRKTY